MADLAKKTEEYFVKWNSHAADAVGALFAEDGSLRDWDVSAGRAGAGQGGRGTRGRLFCAWRSLPWARCSPRMVALEDCS